MLHGEFFYMKLFSSSRLNRMACRYWDFSKRNDGYTDPFPGLHLHKVDMEAYNATKPSDGLKHRNLKWYSVRGSMPSVANDPNMHACAHLYASDRNSLFVM